MAASITLLIPDPIPILGYLDDLLLVPLGIALALKMIPPSVLDECREHARLTTEEGKPTNWAAAAVVMAIWLGIYPKPFGRLPRRGLSLTGRQLLRFRRSSTF